MALSQADLDAIAAAQISHPNLPAGMLLLQAQQESGGTTNPDQAVSSTGAQGLFQILPSTAANPGYGIAPVTNSNDPTMAANFAADYDTALYNKEGSWNQALSDYSGGGYTYDTLRNPGTGAVTDDSSFATGGLDSSYSPFSTGNNASGQSFAMGGANTATGKANIPSLGFFDSIWDIVSRAGLLMAGFLLAFLALAAMFWQSKTVSTSVSNLKGAIP